MASVKLGEHALGDGEGGVGGGHPAVDRSPLKHLFDLVLGEAVAYSGPHVHPKLFELSARHKGGQGYAAAGSAVQARAGPDLTPSIACYEVLKVGGEIRCALYGGVYVPDVDASYQRAPEAGGLSVDEPKQREGDPDRRAGVKDPAGNTWWIATQVD